MNLPRLVAVASLVCMSSFAPSALAQLAAPNTVNSAAIIDRSIEPQDLKHPLTAAGNPDAVISVKATAVDGDAILAISDAKTGDGGGIVGRTSSIRGFGVRGVADAQKGSAIGVFGRSRSQEHGFGVVGRVDEGLMESVGVAGINPTAAGGSSGVFGYMPAKASAGPTYGVQGLNLSSSGVGVLGLARSPEGQTVGTAGISTSPQGIGTLGEIKATTGRHAGVIGLVRSPDGRGVQGVNESTTGIAPGVIGNTSSDKGFGVVGVARHATGTNVGVRGQTLSPNGIGVQSAGNLVATGMKMFAQPHPTDPSQEIRFVCLEGNESGTYFRGTSKLSAGVATIVVPEEFRLVTEAEGLTVQVTAVGAPASLWVESESLDTIVVRGSADVRFHYMVNGVRRGFADFQAIHANTDFVPEERGVPFGTQYPAGLRRILVENGICYPDGTPNEATAAALGWTLRERGEGDCGAVPNVVQAVDRLSAELSRAGGD